jgi:hypothetical protein
MEQHLFSISDTKVRGKVARCSVFVYCGGGGGTCTILLFVGDLCTHRRRKRKKINTVGGGCGGDLKEEVNYDWGRW